jgi:hypothetical protein
MELTPLAYRTATRKFIHENTRTARARGRNVDTVGKAVARLARASLAFMYLTLRCATLFLSFPLSGVAVVAFFDLD